MNALRYSSPVLCALLAAVMVSTAAALESDQLTRADLAGVKPTVHKAPPLPSQREGQAHARHGLPVDSLLTWNDHYFADGFDPDGNPNQHWYTNTVGNPPWHG